MKYDILLNSIGIKKLLLCLIFAFHVTHSFAEINDFKYHLSSKRKFDKSGNVLSGFQYPNYNITFFGEYTFSQSRRDIVNFDLQTLVPINPNFELKCNVQASILNYYVVATIFRPKFILPVGELFIDLHTLYRAMVVYHQHDAVFSVSLGYRMQYVSFNIGWYGRVMAFFDKYRVAGEGYQTEPFNIAYRLEVFARPQYNKWNISACIASYDDYQFERMWQMLFMVGGTYNFSKHWRILGGIQIKPTGMFHLNASLYAMTFRVGGTYIF